MMENYILVDGKAVLEPDMLKWGIWFETANRIVAQTKIGQVKVSTVFLGMDHNFCGNGLPILFETMIFGLPKIFGDGEPCVRYSTIDEAKIGHNEAVDAVRTMLKIAGYETKDD